MTPVNTAVTDRITPGETITVPREPLTVAERLAAVDDDAWIQCPGCRSGLYRKRLRRHLDVCPGCDHHLRLGAAGRLETLADTGSFTERHADLLTADPLGFADTIAYPQRMARVRERTGLREAAVCGTARITGLPVVICVLDFSFQGGSMGAVVGEKIARCAEEAEQTRTPLILCASSGGARMQEGVFSLLQMAKTAAALARMREAGVPCFSVLADPVYGGVSASFANLGDVIVAEPRARAGFAGPQVIAQTIRQQLPPGFQRAEFLLEHGHIDAIVPRGELRSFLGRLLRFHAAAEAARTAPVPPAPAPAAGQPSPAAGSPADPKPDAWATVQLARDPGRPHLGEYAELVFDSFTELRGDRWREDDPSIVGGPALLDGRPVMLIGHRKGRGTADSIARNFGMPHPAGYRKAERLMRYAERFAVPVVTLIDTPGAYPGLRAEEENQSGAIAANLAVMATLSVPVLTVVIGEGGSGGALALGVSDRLLMMANSTLSVISPEGCATILFGDAGRAPDAAAALRMTAADLAELGVADAIVPEPAGGAQADHEQAAAALREALLTHLDVLTGLAPDVLAQQRWDRLRSYGPVGSRPPGVPAGAESFIPRQSGRSEVTS